MSFTASELRETGIPTLGDIAWGAHFCHFYETKQDLLDIVVPYFKKGLENNEFCLWIVADPLGPEAAKKAFKCAVAEADQHLASGRIEIVSSGTSSLSARQRFSGAGRVDIVPSTDWYLKEGAFVAERVIAGWNEKLTEALGKGYAGMRVNANESWLTPNYWKVFSDYEASVDKWLHNRRMIVLCSYPLSGATAAQILDVAHTHQFAIAKRDGHWETSEAPGFLRPRPPVFFSTPVVHSITRLSDGCIMEVNHAFSQMFGYQREELIGRAAFELGLWANANDHDAFIERLSREGTVQDFETQVRIKSGKLLDVIAFAAPLEVAGAPCLLATMYDVTGRKQAEKVVRESQQLLQLVLETLPVSVFVVDTAGDISLINEASKRMWGGMIAAGRERWEQTKGYWHDSGQKIDPADWASVRALSKGEISLNELIDVETYAGLRRIIRNSAAPIRNAEGKIAGAVIVNEDVTDRVRAEEALRRSEDELRRVIDTVPVMAWTLRPDGVVDFLNRRWVEYSGLSLEQFVADPTAPIHPEDVARALEKWRVQLPVGEGYDDEMRLRRADGEYRWFLVRTAPLRDEQGNIVKWYGVSLDIEDRKRAEEALRQAHQRLRILSRRRVQIQEEERRRLARELHDQIGQLLTAAKINLQSGRALSEDSALNSKLADTVRILESVLQQVRKISFALRPPVLDDLGLAPALRWMLSETAGSAGLAAEFFADSNLHRADAESETACYRVAVEAVTNSIRHAGAHKITMEVRNIDHHIELRVRDDGRGFDVGKIERAAERDRLGLSGMRERTFAVGGRFEIKSEPGEGTEIVAKFPLSSAPDLMA